MSPDAVLPDPVEEPERPDDPASSELGDGDGGDGASGSRWALVAVGAILLASLVGGVAIWGVGGDEAPTVSDMAAGCVAKPLRFTVTDDPAVYDEQRRYEIENNTVPPPGFYESEVDETAVLHAASHAYAVVFMRPDISSEAGEGLRAMSERAQTAGSAVIVSLRGQEPGLLALARGYELRCGRGDAAAAAEVNRFAAQLYPSVADPQDRGASLAPAQSHEAPSPADATTPAGAG